MKSRLSLSLPRRRHILSQLELESLSNRETAAQYLTYSVCQFEARGASLLLKLLVTDLWTLFWTILFINLMPSYSRFLCRKTCSMLDVKSRLSHRHILSQLETTAQYSTHTMYINIKAPVFVKMEAQL